MSPRVILDSKRFQLTIKRLCYQLIENFENFDNLVLVGLQPRGVFLSRLISDQLEALTGKKPPYGELDTTFFRDDFKLKPLIPQATSMEVLVEGKQVILIDDVLYTGRTIRAALDALQHFGRPSKVALLVLIDRRFSREIPIQPDYYGMKVDAVFSEKVVVNWQDTSVPCEVTLINQDQPC